MTFEQLMLIVAIVIVVFLIITFIMAIVNSSRISTIMDYAEDGNLEAACAKALAQIEEKKYAEALRRRGMKTILKYGIAFWEKECQVVLKS